jgi:hypothetical protein
MSDSRTLSARTLAGRHAPDLHGAQPPAPDVRRRHETDLQYALRGLDATAREQFLREYAAALQAFERERALVADPVQPPPELPSLPVRWWTPTALLRERSAALDRRARALAELEAGVLYGRNPQGTPTFSPGTLAVFEEKARVDHELRRRESRLLQPWQWTLLVAGLFAIAIALLLQV